MSTSVPVRYSSARLDRAPCRMRCDPSQHLAPCFVTLLARVPARRDTSLVTIRQILRFSAEATQYLQIVTLTCAIEHLTQGSCQRAGSSIPTCFKIQAIQNTLSTFLKAHETELSLSIHIARIVPSTILTMELDDSQTPLLGDGYDPSRNRLLSEFLLSRETKKSSGPVVSSPRSDYPENLQDFVRLMKSANVEGPHFQSQVHLGCKSLGSGAQFDVFGHQHFVHETFPPFDLPYVSKIQGSGKAPVVVAVKRARFMHSYAQAPASTSQQFGFGTPEQLRALTLEVRTLTNPAIHTHRNIVKLLAWGFDFGDSGTRVEPLSLLLILEHGNCSLRHFLSNHKRKIPNPPEQVLQKLGLDVAQGLGALHDAGIIHGDIKTDNVLVFPAEAPFFCVAKLSDFGFSVLDMEKNQKIYNIGTPGWQAPELGDVGVSIDMLTKCDYFSLGLLILRTIVCAHDGYQKTGLEEVSSILQRANISQPTQNCIRDVMQYLLPSRPQERASDLGKVCDQLSQVDQQEFDRTGFWYL
ncbi:kinase-like domain-containing protein [Tuber indicum]|nr:kinase-like domain-containing protein [Tuber indicum]